MNTSHSFKEWMVSETEQGQGFDRVHIGQSFYGKETVGQFLVRHRIPINQGKFVLYHGRPKGSKYTYLRKGTYLTPDIEDAKHFAARDRGLNRDRDIEVIKLILTPDQIEPGIHITLRTDYNLTH